MILFFFPLSLQKKGIILSPVLALQDKSLFDVNGNAGGLKNKIRSTLLSLNIELCCPPDTKIIIKVSLGVFVRK